jgi:putative nucleotidyltransferase with HDIG domain
MNNFQANPIAPLVEGSSDMPRSCRDMLDSLNLCFGTSFSLLDTYSGQYLHTGAITYRGGDRAQSEICSEVIRRGRPELIAEEDPIAVLCVPIVGEPKPRYVAIAPLLLHPADPNTISQSFAALGFDPDLATQWTTAQTPWIASRAVHLAELACARGASDYRHAQMQREIDDLSSHLANAYEELSLLYGLTQKLKISASIEDIGQKALEWLAETVSAEGLVLELLPQQRHDSENLGHTHRDSTFLRFGRPVVDHYQFARLIEHFGLSRSTQPLVVNLRKDQTGDWPVPQVRQAVIVPLTEGDNLFGWLAAINHDEHSDFGSSEASLLSSVATIIGIHAGNIELYRKQAEFLAGVVRALTSSIDAKDPYTCGHSDRVARVAVALADQLGLSVKAQETIYLSGLLHDIGKIGIDDQVLRKPGKLTTAEYEHIKMHAEIGYRILKDLKQLDQVLPVVRHHHEAWDGSGYPFGLAGEAIPLFARIVAVADSFDAMSSDRPYRKGMDDEKLDAIMKAGAGKQWDADVVEAYFSIRDQLRHIAHDEHAAPSEELAGIT